MAEATTDSTVEIPPVSREGAGAAQAAPFRPSAAGWAARYTVAGAVILFVFLLPVLVPFDFQADLISRSAIFACVALSMNILVGYLGQLSLGHQAFFGIGAFASASIVFKGYTEPAQLAAATSLDPAAAATGAPISY